VAGRGTLATVGGVAVAGVLVVALASFTVESAKAESPDGELSEMLRELVPPSADRLASGDVPGGGKEGRYLVTWTDPVSIGAAGFGLLDALERRGFDVGVGPEFTSSMTRGRAFPRDDASAEVHLAIGPRAIAEWRAKPDAVELAFERPSARDRAEYQRLRRSAIAQLRDAGLDDLVPVIDDSLFMASIRTEVPESARRTIERMLQIGQPAAIFVEPTAGT
jgi:hypothetical protein